MSKKTKMYSSEELEKFYLLVVKKGHSERTSVEDRGTDGEDRLSS